MRVDDAIVSETARLRLRRLRLGDADNVAEMVSDPEQMRFYPDTKSRAEVDRWLATNIAVYAERGFGVWCLEALPGDEFAGYCGIRPLELDGRSEVELVWHVKKAYWNNGLGTAAARVAVRLGDERFGLSTLVAIIHPENGASLRVAQKLGMKEHGQLIHDGEPVVVYRTAAS